MKSSTLGFCLCALLCVATRAGAATITVNAGGNLQAALDAARPGDTLVLQAGAVFTGNFVLPAKGGSAFITVRSAASDASLPAAGVRITPAYASALPKIRSDHNGAAFKTAAGASYWRLMFLEILPSEATSSANLVELGGGGSAQNALGSVPHHLVMDRCYVHGNPAYAQRRGIALNSGDTQIVNSHIGDIKGAGVDTQAIAGWNGPGPYLIENNYVEATGENILFGGSDVFIPNLVPSNIVIRRNLVSRPLAWMTQGWTVKNLIEFKNADTVLVEGNVIENNWAAGQQGYSIVLTPRHHGGAAGLSAVRNITVKNNIIRHVAAVFNIFGYDDSGTSLQTSDIVISNNLVYDVSKAYSTPGNPANGWFAVIGNGPRDITFDHNTVDNDGNDTIVFYEATSAPATTAIYGFVLTNNLLRDNAYGIFGSGSQPGTVSLNAYTPGAVVLGNAIGGANASRYPGGNDYPTLAQWLADFVNRAAGSYQLRSTSLSRGAATDGTDIGVDFTKLNAALNGSSTPPPPPPPPAGSTPYTGTRMALPGRIQVENYDKGGEGVAYHDLTAGNSGGAYRSDDVDIKATSDASGAYHVKTVRAGEWLAYSVTVATAGTYSISLRAASSGGGGTVHIALDGTNVSGPIVLPDTGSWSVWQTVTKTGVSLAAGSHILKLIVDANGSAGTAADINWIDVTSAASSPASTPFSGTAIAVPGRIEAENYDKGGEGIAYHDTTAGNSTGAYRADGVDIRATTDAGGGYNVKSVRAGEWLAYSIKVAAAGTYAIDVRIASSGAGGTAHVTIDGTNVTGSIALADTGGWDVWKTVTKTGVALPAGVHVLKLIVDSNGPAGTAADVNWLAIR
jgi:hypothetical protein